jgi:hypothetical protein
MSLQFLPTKIKKDVSFDNRLCNAYLSAGRCRHDRVKPV